MTKSTIGFGITLGYSLTPGGTFFSIAELLEVTPPAVAVDEVKVYRSDNTAAVVERIPGWIENGDAEATITYLPASRTTLEALIAIPAYWKVTYPKVVGQTGVGDVDSFSGFLKSLGKETPLKDAMKCKIKIAVNGAIAFTVGS